MKNHWSSIILVEDLARIAAERGEAERAARLLGAVANLREEAGAAPLPFEREAMDRVAASVRDILGPAAYVTAFQAGQALSLTEALDFATTMVGEPARVRETHPASGPLLVVNALGGLEIAVDGAPLPSEAWRSPESRDLLIYLVCHPAGRTREQIGRALWLNASAIHIKIRLHLTLHQLRRTLGRPDWIVFEEGRYRVNPGFRVEFDGLQFETLVREAQSALAKRGDRGPLQRALGHYKGDFLKDVGAGEWSQEPRERWRQLYAEGRQSFMNLA